MTIVDYSNIYIPGRSIEDQKLNIMSQLKYGKYLALGSLRDILEYIANRTDYEYSERQVEMIYEYLEFDDHIIRTKKNIGLLSISEEIFNQAVDNMLNWKSNVQ